jgi:hypothetical protein
MMMIVAEKREITMAIQPGFPAGVNVNSVQNLCAKGGHVKNFWGLSRKSADNPVTSKIPLDLGSCGGASYPSTGKRTPTGTRGTVPNTVAARKGGHKDRRANRVHEVEADSGGE